MKLWMGLLALLGLGALALQGLNRQRANLIKERLMETRSTARRLEKATFAAG